MNAAAMNAAELPTGDIGPIQERFVTMIWEIGDASGEIELKARYRINYASVRDRGLGINPDIQLIAVETREGAEDWRRARLTTEQWQSIISMIETDEIGLD